MSKNIEKFYKLKPKVSKNLLNDTVFKQAGLDKEQTE